MENKGKNKRRQLEVFDTTHNTTLSVDSNEEIDVVHWLNEAVDNNLIEDFYYQPESYRLADSAKYVDVTGKEKTLYREHQYTADFCIVFDPSRQLELAKELKVQQCELSNSQCSAFVDVKGTFNKNARSFSTDRKWVWQKFKVFIYELVPQKFFQLFGVPEKSRLSPKKKQPRKCFLGFKSIAEAFKLSH